MRRHWLGIILILIALTSSGLYSQSTGDVVVLLQGKVYDNGGKPVKVKINFTDSKGKNISTTSNSSDGFYQQVLKPGVHYTVSFEGFIPLGNSTIDIPNVMEYTEISSTFTVQKIDEGLKLADFWAFEPQDSVLAGEYEENFSLIKSFLKANINVNLIVTVSMSDSYFSKKKVKVKYQDKKGRTRTKRVTLKAEEQLQDILKARLAAVQEYIGTLQIRANKISYKTVDEMGPKPPKKKKKKKSKNSSPEPAEQKVNNVKIEVGKIIKM